MVPPHTRLAGTLYQPTRSTERQTPAVAAYPREPLERDHEAVSADCTAGATIRTTSSCDADASGSIFRA